MVEWRGAFGPVLLAKKAAKAVTDYLFEPSASEIGRLKQKFAVEKAKTASRNLLWTYGTVRVRLWAFPEE
ncbi:hypothetical protein PoMZ_12168 [Pyricularia oryzae]|uniref:Uncharacterized protein n=1 Tax=Pyricularia oryzae TaxID=318829 RepID=A0A4P7NM40_PYROR|nr:hypothetical protein PoMZ_12168 [Pyricularia oryzae]